MPCHGQHFNQFHCVSSFNNRDFGSWVAMTNCCISMRTEHSACSAWSLTCAQLEPAFYPVFLLACLLNLILSFLVASFILLSFFVSLFFPFVLVLFAASVCDFTPFFFPSFFCFCWFLGLVSLFCSLFSCGHVRTVDLFWPFLTASFRSLLVVWCLHGVKSLTWSWKHHCKQCNKDSPPRKWSVMQCNASSAKCK